MSINTTEHAKIFQTELDKQIAQEATTGWMEANAAQLIYNGGNEIKIPSISMQGLGDYDKDLGYVQGGVSFKYQTKALTQDRGRQFILDRNDVDENNFSLAAANVMSEFQRVKIIPEIDAYRYSTLASSASIIKDGYMPDEESIFDELYEQVFEVASKAGTLDELVISIAFPVYRTLINSDKIQKKIEAGAFSAGDVNLAVKTLDGIPIIPVNQDRMKTKFSFNDGITAGQEDGGFEAHPSAKDINWIIMPKYAPIAIAKTDNVKIISPEMSETHDAWKVLYRKYHDVFVKDNAKELIAICTN